MARLLRVKNKVVFLRAYPGRKACFNRNIAHCVYVHWMKKEILKEKITEAGRGTTVVIFVTFATTTLVITVSVVTTLVITAFVNTDLTIGNTHA